ncbi:MAG: HNH endonuclease signature motif containing protein [Lachnospira eligens]
MDHFIPWSFVMNDELWNLMPMDSSLFSKKGFPSGNLSLKYNLHSI